MGFAGIFLLSLIFFRVSIFVQSSDAIIKMFPESGDKK